MQSNNSINRKVQSCANKNWEHLPVECIANLTSINLNVTNLINSQIKASNDSDIKMRLVCKLNFTGIFLLAIEE